ncbi:MAG: SigB/SigF/SigG family RNA polymerase sigma factor [Anaeroplasmataceae bacterium]
MYKVNITGVDTSKLEILSNERMNELLIKIKEGDLTAREEMIKGNLKLILSVIKKFNNKKENLDDLFQVGCIGLMKAIDNFDTSHNVKFSTYAVPMIIGEIRRYLRDSGSIRVSRNYKDIAYKALNYKEEYYKTHQHEPTIDEIAAFVNVEPIDVILALEAIQDTISMQTAIYDNGGDVIELEEKLGSEDDTIAAWAREHMLKEAFNRLNKREKKIIIERYFKDKTQMEIALEMDISQAQVSRIEKSALKIMKDVIK